MKTGKSFVKTFVLFALVFALLFCSCSAAGKKASAIAVFVPGVISGSPVYEMLAQGVTEAVDKYNADQKPEDAVVLDVIEAGTNQAEWGSKITALASSGKYDLIISSNSSLPEIIEPLTAQFPKQKFIVLDAYLPDNKSIATVRYNQREQGYLTGYAAGLVTVAEKTEMVFANKAKKIALIAAQEYPVMNNTILPAFTEGAKAVDPEIEVEFRIVGNWYDGGKSADIARELYLNNGVDVILPIAGGANQGVIVTAKALGFYVAWFDDNGYEKAPGLVISSSVMEQKRMAREMTEQYLAGKTAFGTAKTVGVADGYVDFVLDDPLFVKAVPASIREKMEKVVLSIKNGELTLPVLD